MRRLGVAAAALLLAASGAAQTPASPKTVSPKPTAARTPAKSKAAQARPDFTGDWVLDEKASRGVPEAMEGAILRVRQTGDHIWVEPVGGKGRRLLSDEIVADGRSYEKRLGARQRGTVQAAWGKDGELWIEAVVVSEDKPEGGGRQRMIWRLRDGGQTWTRQTRTLQEDGTAHDTFLVFRKRPLGSFVPTPRPTPAPSGN